MLVTDYQYFGNICFIELLYKEKQVCFDSHAPFTKMSFKNKMVILSAQGPLALTIPIVGGRDQKTAINNIRIAYDAPWQAQHFKALKTCYKRAPYFEYYEADLEKLYTTKTELLIEFLEACHQFLQKAVKGKWKLIQYNEYVQKIKEEETKKEIHPWQPNNYAQFPIQHEYQQVFTSPSGFIQNLSILDMLFCVGGKEISKQLSENLD
ncbi:MAG: hypothetical protein RL262_1317 [Bacteroidota bacterium]|jgi:hypothetical protein